VILRVEHRFDDSRGPGGSFYQGHTRLAAIPPWFPLSTC
jgi:hypothetical protein